MKLNATSYKDRAVEFLSVEAVGHVHLKLKAKQKHHTQTNKTTTDKFSVILFFCLSRSGGAVQVLRETAPFLPGF